MTDHGKASRHALELNRLALLKRALAAEAIAVDPEANRRDDDAGFPLLPAQERLFVIEQLYDTEGAYNIAILARLCGSVSHDAIRAAFEFLMQRHDALRLSMHVDRGQPLQRASPALSVDFEFFDLRQGAAADARVQALAEREAAQRFQLDRPPLWRVRLYRVADTDYRILLCIHHIIADGGSLAVLLEELPVAYAAIQAGRQPPLPRSPVRFADHVDRVRQQPRNEATARALAYWQKQLEGVPNQLALPRRVPAVPVSRFRGGRKPVSISVETTQGLKAIARDSNATLFMVLLAAYDVLLHRLSGQSSFLVAVPVANRRAVESQRLVGFFVNTLLLRADVSGEQSFRDVLAQTRSTAVAAFEHQDTPFAELVEHLNPERDLERQPLAQVMFVLQNTTLPTLSMPEVELRILPFHNGTAKFDLLLDLHEQGTALSGYLEYRSGTFSAEFAEQVVLEYTNLLDEIADSPLRTVSDLESNARRRDTSARPLTPAEVLSSWSGRHTLHGRFRERARSSPDAIALTYQGRHLSYSSLDRRSDELARLLRRHGIARGHNVGVLLRRAPEMVALLLAILKAGAAYVPLDPIYPTERLRDILERSGCSVLVSEEALLSALPRERGRVLILKDLVEQPGGVDDVLGLPSGSPAEGRRRLTWPSVCPDNAAYIVFTSGSTGAPKGVLAHHRGALNHLDHVARKYSLSPNDVILQAASLISDASIEDLFGPLLQGCRVVLMPSADAQDPTVWLRLIEKERVTAILATTPRFLAQLGRTGQRIAGDRRALRLIFVNGEPLAYEDCAVARQGLGPQVEIVNQYGPTEAAITDTEFSVDARSPEQGRTPLGVPLSNVEFQLLDARMRSVVQGSPGELYIGGVGLAHGYQAQPGLTAARFVPNPFGTAAGARLYRSGDRLVFTKAEGYQFLGRVDHQVKIRGYRIEPGEIEAAIQAYPGVVASLVTAWTDGAGNEQLVAYVVADDGNIDTSRLRLLLKGRLPRFMVPTVFVPLPALPLTTNGKVDRAALPSPAAFVVTEREKYEPPVGSQESAVCAAFEQVLARGSVGRHDNFFDLGGHSLAAIRLASLLSERLGRELMVRDIFLNPNVAELTASLSLGTSSERSTPRTSPVKAATTRRNVRIHRASLLEQIRSGALAKVNAVAVSTLPNELRPLLGDAPALAELGGEAEVASISDMHCGRIASVWLPIFTRDVYADSGALLARLLPALDLAEAIGASAVSLTGLLGSATTQGVDLVRERDASGRQILVTTGHATTVASIILAIESIVRASGRRVADERMVILGMGSIGSAVAETLLAAGLMPRELLLCDVYDRRDVLTRTAADLKQQAEDCAIDCAHGPAGSVPSEVYEATLIVGATNAPEVLDVGRLRPGTLIVDDSAPHCFDATRMLERIQRHKDVLATSGGLLTSPRPLARDLYLPVAIETIASRHGLALPIHEPEIVPACALSALLTARKLVEPSVGPCTAQECLRHMEVLRAMEVSASSLQLAGALIDSQLVLAFRERFRNVAY